MDKKEKIYKVYDNDNELLYLVSENNEDANKILFEKYKPIIDLKVKKYINIVSNKGIDYNDLYQEGLIGLDEAIKGYVEKKDYKFSTFATLCIDRKICSAVRKASRKKHSMLNDSYSLDYKLDEDKSFIDTFISTSTESTEDMLISKENNEYLIKRISEELTALEKQVFNLRLNGKTNKEIGEILNKSYKSIESAIFRIKNKIKSILKENDWLLFQFMII